MYLEIITPDRKVFEGEVDAATFPGSDGSFQVLNNHAPIISSLAKGDLIYKTKEGSKILIVDGGVVEVRNNHVIVLAESVE
ncbi:MULTISPECIES: ATP synthase F1 subunit epsilon [unclassified Imperialibacter]|jgi:F-type H+-transporting ATPase subunit epsilon|uniref:ATP synthase F1 subunit epsilon n=1 Tax=unclassified Imperialibacter TaxID=2629706 RepID=UPI00125AFF8F|nr:MULTISPECIES: ATP synthase F1 subunit epsilon [unclassified Imperialibacter]CAD5247057.1 ATP synthase F1 subunit epsilon [Imperialibacter sp. 75]CAD5247125.1 ATP synthase F1 subunit epsilon [Imperialibacter sp. 89]VVS96649.1 ATP synthase F1 subunit epsilon [Imperialibacter sp. EC-SDR9]|tara:strand:+ start:3501 stop:3743 length:243 start_codon:yes stop_codon:yes gene_type:complete